jgi:hypothetical protein
MPFGDELSLTVAQFPAAAVLAHTSATAAATMSDFRTSTSFVRMPRIHLGAAAGSAGTLDLGYTTRMN